MIKLLLMIIVKLLLLIESIKSSIVLTKYL